MIACNHTVITERMNTLIIDYFPGRIISFSSIVKDGYNNFIFDANKSFAGR